MTTQTYRPPPSYPGPPPPPYYGAPPPRQYYGMPMPYGPPGPPVPPLQPVARACTKPKTKEEKRAELSEPAGRNDKDTNGDGKEQGGLDLLASLALPVGGSGGAADQSKEKPIKAKKPATGSKKKRAGDELGSAGSKAEKLFIDTVRDVDVLCGRGGKSNHHPGNKRYRQVVSEMKRTYQSTGAKTAKTDLSRAIVEHVVGYGGRFIKRDEETGKYFLLTKAQARRKTSQALRETKELKWTM